jgi:hypothetical protein
MEPTWTARDSLVASRTASRPHSTARRAYSGTVRTACWRTAWAVRESSGGHLELQSLRLGTVQVRVDHEGSHQLAPRIVRAEIARACRRSEARPSSTVVTRGLGLGVGITDRHNGPTCTAVSSSPDRGLTSPDGPYSGPSAPSFDPPRIRQRRRHD